ncbi:hypothetical protein G6F57_014653 [Rhizopus arrhizus]|nr:hypothetical protein G6F57_014653 [Rhizopus arrhizus]
MQVHPQLVDARQAEMLGFALTAQRDRKPAGDARGQLGRGRRVGAGHETGALHLDGRQRHLIGRAEPARHPAHRMRFQLRATRDAHRRGQLGSRATQVELVHAARRERPQIVRIEHIQQCVGELGIVVLDALGYARTEQREGLDQALDMRVLAALGGELQATGDLRVALGELAPVTAEVAQLALVVRQQVLHQAACVRRARVTWLQVEQRMDGEMQPAGKLVARIQMDVDVAQAALMARHGLLQRAADGSTIVGVGQAHRGEVRQPVGQQRLPAIGEFLHVAFLERGARVQQPLQVAGDGFLVLLQRDGLEDRPGARLLGGVVEQFGIRAGGSGASKARPFLALPGDQTAMAHEAPSQRHSSTRCSSVCSWLHSSARRAAHQLRLPASAAGKST